MLLASPVTLASANTLLSVDSEPSGVGSGAPSGRLAIQSPGGRLTS
jgi:hypothetical protein